MLPKSDTRSNPPENQPALPLHYAELATHCFGNSLPPDNFVMTCPVCGDVNMLEVSERDGKPEPALICRRGCDAREILARLTEIVRTGAKPTPASTPTQTPGPTAILERVARLAWLDSSRPAGGSFLETVTCPADRIPDVMDLADLLADEDRDALRGISTDWPDDGAGPENGTEDRQTRAVCRLLNWLEAAHKQRPDLVEALVARWQQMPRRVDAFKPVRRSSLPRLHRIGNDADLPDFPPSVEAPDRQPYLPTLGPVVTECPSWLLWLYDRAGGESMAQGRGAPWPLRLFVGALLHLRVNQRTGDWFTLRFRTGDVIAWLHPNGWANRRRDWEKLPAALDAMRERLGYVPVPGLGDVAMLIPSVIPRTPGDPLVEFTIRIPTEAAKGARIEWPTLCQYGTESAVLYRAYLSAQAFIDRSAHNGHGQTRLIAAPERLDDGRVRRRKGGAIVRSQTELVENPGARYVKALDDGDLARMVGYDAGDKRRRHDARQAFERLHGDRVIELHRDGKGYRLFKPE